MMRLHSDSDAIRSAIVPAGVRGPRVISPQVSRGIAGRPHASAAPA